VRAGENGIEVPFEPIPVELISDGAMVRARLQEVIDYIGDRRRLYFSARLAIGIALLSLAGEMRSIITPETVARYLDKQGFTQNPQEEEAADGQS
jgi:hypothetical protein